MSEFNFIDYIIIAVFGLSVISGLTRGFLKEIISLGTWIAACVVSTLFSSKLAATFSGAGSQMQSMVSSATSGTTAAVSAQAVSMLSIGASFLGLFVVTLMAGSVVNYLLTSAAVATFSLTNRLLGGLFGALRGFVIVVVLIFVTQLTPVATQSFWTSSQLVGMFQPSVAWFGGLVSPGLEALKTQAEQAVQNVSGEVQQGVQGLYHPSPK